MYDMANSHYDETIGCTFCLIHMYTLFVDLSHVEPFEPTVKVCQFSAGQRTVGVSVMFLI